LKKTISFLILFSCIGLTACADRLETFGFENLKEAEHELAIKDDTKQSVLQKFNVPNAMSVDKKVWYYVYLEKKVIAFLPEKISNDILLKLTFDEKGILVKKELIEGFLKKQRMLAHTTPIERSKKNDNYLTEILENIGTVAPDEERR